MRAMLLLAATLAAGAVGVSKGVIPLPPQMAQAVRALGGNPAQVKDVNISPVAAYNKVLPEILKGGHTPQELGFQAKPVTIPPGSFHGMTATTINPNLGQNGFAASIASQIQQNNIRMQDMANFARNPAGWHGPLPH